MTNHTIIFSAQKQELRVTNGFARFASDTINYIYARFELDSEWASFDAVKAVWQNDTSKVSQLITNGAEAPVPIEMLSRRSAVTVNLVGYSAVNGELTERLTTYPCQALIVDKTAIVEADESSGVSPSLFDQYIAIVATEVSRVTDMTVSAHESSEPTVYKTEDGGAVHLSFGLVRGPQGIQGIQGEPGPPGSGEENVQSDWNVTDTTSDAYILHKPTIPTATSDLVNDSGFITDVEVAGTSVVSDGVANIGHASPENWGVVKVTMGVTAGDNYTTTDLQSDINGSVTTTKLARASVATTAKRGLMSAADKTKLDGIASGAEVNVNADWNAVSGDAQILNKPTIPTKVSDLTNDSGYITGYTETDPTVPSWAKASSKPSYTASEVGAVPTSRKVNGKALTSDITLSASDVSALPSSTSIPSKTSDLTNDSGFITLADLPIYNGGVS